MAECAGAGRAGALEAVERERGLAGGVVDAFIACTGANGTVV